MSSDPLEQLEQHLRSLRAAGLEHTMPRPVDSSSLPDSSSALAAGSVSAAGLAPQAVPTSAPAPSPVAIQPSLFAAVEPAEVSTDLEQRRVALHLLAEKVAACTRCPQLAATRTQTVFGVGPLGAELCFVGEAPGADEDRVGEPFVGAAGQLLNRIIAACGMKREEVYICNILRCRPPGNRTPTPEEAAHCREYLEETIRLVQPKFLCALGGTATKYLLGIDTGITKLRGRWLDYRGIPVMATFHPSYLLRNPEAKKEVWADMKLLLARMGKPIPGASSSSSGGGSSSR
ncbi:MAG: uracil-DNA glycosylase [Gemmataceae bacterium]